MMKLFQVVLAVAAIAAAGVVNTNAVKVPITVYYESLCPDSAKFITEQLYPAVSKDLKHDIDIEWHPFGKSEFTTQGSDVLFNCHHGENECYGNKVHACAIEHIQSSSYRTENTRESLTLDFINCLMKIGKNFPDNVYPGAKCAHETGINNWENIQQCANSTDGSMLLMKHGESTHKFQNPLSSVPTVVFKDHYDAKLNAEAQKNFVGAFCKHVPFPQPRYCSTQNAAASVKGGLIPIIALVYGITKLFY